MKECIWNSTALKYTYKQYVAAEAGVDATWINKYVWAYNMQLGE